MIGLLRHIGGLFIQFHQLSSFFYGCLIVLILAAFLILISGLIVLKKERDQFQLSLADHTTILEEKHAEQMNQAFRFAEIGKQAAAIFHEIRTPLTAASLSTENLQQHIQDQRLLESAQLIMESLNVITQFVETNQKQIQQASLPCYFSPLTEVKLAVHIMEVKAHQNLVQLQTHLVDTPPLFGCPLHFYQIVSQLIANALDSYLDLPAHRHKIVKISLENYNHHLSFQVQDYGCGIPISDQAKIFELMFTTKTAHQGCGIGLAVAKSAMDNFGGQITFHSVAGQGSIFVADFPLP